LVNHFIAAITATPSNSAITKIAIPRSVLRDLIIGVPPLAMEIYFRGMNTLSTSQLIEKAPAARPLPHKHAVGLIDTLEFLAVIKKRLGHRPVMAIQGKPHADVPDEGRKTTALAKRERQGRHLIVCADGRGSATILLNSHTVRRKAWIAAGFFRSDPAVPTGGLLLIGVALPLQRWRGFDVAIEELERYRPALAETRTALRAYRPRARDADALAEAVSRRAYLKGHKPIAADELVGAWSLTLYDSLYGMLKRVVDGNLPAAAVGRRKVKPVRGPDALMHAGNAIWNLGVETMGATVALPTFRKT
jgi:hypothetical protein